MTSCEPSRCGAYSEDLRWRIVWQTEALHYTSEPCPATLAITRSRHSIILPWNLYACAWRFPARTVQTSVRLLLHQLPWNLHACAWRFPSIKVQEPCKPLYNYYFTSHSREKKLVQSVPKIVVMEWDTEFALCCCCCCCCHHHHLFVCFCADERWV